jgi:hypothetical protein
MRGALVAVASLIVLVGGCAQDADMDAGKVANVAAAKGLTVQLDLPARYFQTGDTVRVSVTATNTTGKPIEIHSPTGAAVLVRITRQTMLHPEEIRVYPTSATTNILSWTLPAGQSRPFVLMVPVEPDWPVHEIVFLSAELNGYPALAPNVAIMVKPASK